VKIQRVGHVSSSNGNGDVLQSLCGAPYFPLWCLVLMPSDFQVPTLRRHHIPVLPSPTRVPGRSLSPPDVRPSLQHRTCPCIVLVVWWAATGTHISFYASGMYSVAVSPRQYKPPSRRSFLPSVTDRGCPHTWNDTSRDLNPHYRRMASETKISILAVDHCPRAPRHNYLKTTQYSLQ
jgi:hypothetical protein